jgi:hypothetical protein
MELVSVYSHNHNLLLAIKFDGNDSDEFRKAFNQWQDVEYLEDFFETHLSDLKSKFYQYTFGNISVEDAVKKTISESQAFEAYLRVRIQLAAKQNLKILNDEIFKPLDEFKKTTKLHYEANKAYGLESNSWLRLYAIRITATIFVVSGSAIKLTKAMQDRPHTQKELQKLKKTAQFLKEIGFQDDYDYGFIEIQPE